MCDYCSVGKGDSYSVAIMKHERLSFGILGTEDLIVDMDNDKPALDIRIGRKDYFIPIKYCPMCGRRLCVRK